MNRWYGSSILGKLSFQLIDGVRFSTLYSTDRDEGHGYDHGFKYNPDGMGAGYGKTDFFSFQWNHLLSANLFYDLKLSTTKNYSGGYLYKDPLDSNYVHDKYLESFGPVFYTGGQQKNHDERTVNSKNAKFDINWIVNKNHNIKTGLNLTNYSVDNAWH